MLRFGAFEFDRARQELRRDGSPLKLQEQPRRILELLLDHAGEVVTREAIRQRLWPSDTYVDFDHSVNTAMKKLRQALGDEADQPRFIETVPKRGYRFLMPVAESDRSDSLRSPGEPEDHGPSALAATRRRRIAVAALAGLIALGVALATVMTRRSARAPAPNASTRGAQLAVLPLRVLSPDQDERYLGLGLADAVITHLANIPTLRVRPTSAVVRFDEMPTVDARAAGEELDVEHVLVGTLQRSADTYRVSLQLMRTADGVAIWGRNYDVPRRDFLGLEDTVAAQVVEALRIQLTRSQRERLLKRYTTNAPAYELYLQARALMVNYTEPRMRQAIGRYEQALRVAPDYALARAGLATSLAWFSVRYAYEAQAASWGRRAAEEAQRALALDPDLAEAHLALANAAGTAYGHFDWNLMLAEIDKAIAIDPGLDLAYVGRIRAYYHLGLFDAAIDAYSSARRLSPASSIELERLLVATELFEGRFTDARSRAESLLAKTDAPVVHQYLALAIFYLGDRPRASSILAAITRGGHPDVRSQAARAAVLAAEGRAEEAEELAGRIGRGPYMDHHVAYSLGTAYAQLHKTDLALRWLKESTDTGFPCYPWFAADPLLDPIRKDAALQPFFAELRARFEIARHKLVTPE